MPVTTCHRVGPESSDWLDFDQLYDVESQTTDRQPAVMFVSKICWLLGNKIPGDDTTKKYGCTEKREMFQLSDLQLCPQSHHVSFDAISCRHWIIIPRGTRCGNFEVM